jgi:hypothetical protein
MQLTELIKRAEDARGSTSAVAKAMGVPNPIVFAWKSGARTCTAEDRALLAEIAGVDPIPEIAAALLERCAGKPKEERLRALLERRLKSVGNF